ncbi:oligosaccharide flippase family protein [Vibrio alginolyticus]
MYKSIAKSFLLLSFTKVFLIIIPFIIYPYLIRIYGPEHYGDYVYSMAVLAFAQVFINYGFDLSATKLVAESKSDEEKKSKIFFNVLYCKLLISVVSGFIFVSLFILLDMDVSISLYLYCLSNVVIDSLYPFYYFTAIEKQLTSLKIQVFTKFIFMSLVFSLVNETSNINLIPILYLVGSIAALILSFAFLKKNGLRLVPVDIKYITFLIIDGISCFLSRLSSVLNVKMGMVFLGSSSNSVVVSQFDLSQKLIDLARVPVDIINQIIFPKVVINKELKIAYVTLFLFCIYGLLFVGVVYLFGEKIVLLIGGHELVSSSQYFKLMSWLVPLSAGSWIVGNNILIAFGHPRLFLYSTLISTMFFVFYCIYFKVNESIDAEVIIYGMLISSFLLLLIRLIFAKFIINKQHYEKFKVN